MRRLAFGNVPTRKEMLRYFFNERAWFYNREHQPEDHDPLPHEIEWAAGENNEHKIAYVNDHRLGVEFFAFDSTVEGKIDVIEKKLLDGPFDVLSKEGLLQRFRECDAGDRLHYKHWSRPSYPRTERRVPTHRLGAASYNSDRIVDHNRDKLLICERGRSGWRYNIEPGVSNLRPGTQVSLRLELTKRG